MSVRATERLIGDVVSVSSISKSPQMVVQSIDEKTKIITTVWFTSDNVYQQGTFPASALDRVDVKPKKTTKKANPKKTKK